MLKRALVLLVDQVADAGHVPAAPCSTCAQQEVSAEAEAPHSVALEQHLSCRCQVPHRQTCNAANEGGHVQAM